MIKKKYYAMYDLQMSKYLSVGMNTTVEKKLIADVWEWWIGGADLDEEDYNTMSKWGWKEKKDWLENTELRIDTNSTKFEEYEEDRW